MINPDDLTHHLLLDEQGHYTKQMPRPKRIVPCSLCGQMVERGNTNTKQVTCYTCKQQRIIKYSKAHRKKYDPVAQHKQYLKVKAQTKALRASPFFVK